MSYILHVLICLSSLSAKSLHGPQCMYLTQESNEGVSLGECDHIGYTRLVCRPLEQGPKVLQHTAVDRVCPLVPPTP